MRSMHIGLTVRLLLVAVGVAAGTAGAAVTNTVVQWGEAGGDTNVVPAYLQSVKPLNTTYVADTDSSPTNSTYYTNSVGRSPAFNLTSKTAWDSAGVYDDAGGDYITSGKNSVEQEAMVVWEDFLTSDTQLNGLAVEISANGSGFSNGVYRFVIQKNTSEWYASEPMDLSVDFSSEVAVDPSALTWYNFTPMSSGAATVGSEAAIDMTDMATVGIYYKLGEFAVDNSFQGVKIRYFKVTAEDGPTSGPIVQWGSIEGEADIVDVKLGCPASTLKTYTPGYIASPVVTNNPLYYTNNTDRTPSFNMAASFTSKAWINNLSPGDVIQGTDNGVVMEYMVVWEDYLDSGRTNLLTLDMTIFRGNNTTETNDVRFVIEKGDGSWYVSEPWAMTTKWTKYRITESAADLTWYHFTPFGLDGNAAGVATVGSEASPDMNGVVSVGYFVRGEASGGWQEFRMQYFKAIATGSLLTPSPDDRYAYWAYGYGAGAWDEDDDGDGLSNFGEYVFGGIPVLPEGLTNQGASVSFDTASGEYAFSLRADTNLSYYVLTTSDLVGGSWTTNGPTQITVGDGEIDAYTSSVGTAEDTQFIKLVVE